MTTEPKERPILFSAPMVRAILDGRKTVTRRIVRPQPEPNDYGSHSWPSSLARTMVEPREMGWLGPYGSRGDHLWVRETWRPFSRADVHDGRENVFVRYPSDESTLLIDRRHVPAGWTAPKQSARGLVPGIHMPRWACRLVLAVQSVRVERLHAITEEDIFAEGLDMNEAGTFYVDHGPDGIAEFEDPRTAFAFLWDSINGSRAPWESNPWVWRVEFSTHFVRQGST